jgi:hypothetical protein
LLSTKQQVARWHIGDLDLTAVELIEAYKKQHGVIDETSKPIYNYGICTTKALQLRRRLLI